MVGNYLLYIVELIDRGHMHKIIMAIISLCYLCNDMGPICRVLEAINIGC